jgi:hypothetical protein
MPSEVWCAVGLYPARNDAEQALAAPGAFLPFLPSTVEAWHALLQPIAHRGECNHLDRTVPGLLLEAHADDPGGPLVVMTTAGFDLGPQLDMAWVIDFRRNVDRIRLVAKGAEGNFARQVFVPHVRGDDGVTMTVWRDDAANDRLCLSPRPPPQRDRTIQAANRRQIAPRFTRLRPLKTSGTWQGSCPVELARRMTA